MALTSTTTWDIVGQTQTITFYQSALQVDQIVFSSNQITFSNISSFNLSKSDYLLYFQYLNAYFTTLLINFPSIGGSVNGKFPVCQFEILETSLGVTHIDYIQSSQGSTIYSINYVPVALSASFVARASPITITLQEFFYAINILTQYTNQISLN